MKECFLECKAMTWLLCREMSVFFLQFGLSSKQVFCYRFTYHCILLMSRMFLPLSILSLFTINLLSKKGHVHNYNLLNSYEIYERSKSMKDIML